MSSNKAITVVWGVFSAAFITAILTCLIVIATNHDPQQVYQLRFRSGDRVIITPTGITGTVHYGVTRPNSYMVYYWDRAGVRRCDSFREEELEASLR